MIWDNFTKGWKNIFNFTGRASRAEYWAFNILSWIFMIVLTTAILLPIAFSVDDPKETIGKIAFLFLFIIIPYMLANFSQTVRRIRDMGVSGWWTLLFLPINTILWAIPSIIIGFIPSKENESIQRSQTEQPKVSPEIKDFHYTPDYNTTSNHSAQQKPSPSRTATARLPLKDFN